MKMFRAVPFLLCFCLLLSVPCAAVSVSAEAAVLLCADTGEVLFGKNEKQRMSMASTTKIMTSLLALEAGTPQRKIEVTQQMTAVEGTSMGLLPGDTVTLYGLVCGMLLSSGNDAANTAALVLGGSAEKFSERMNARAAQIGMTDTHFVTPSGLDDPAHYSTAYDMALLGAEAIRNPQFLQICQSQKLSASYGNPPYKRMLSNHNRLLQLYAPCIGIKTGFTKKSGRCLVSAARQDGVTLVAVTLRASDDWNDHIALYTYGFSAVHAEMLDDDISAVTLPVTGGTGSCVPVAFSSPPTAVSRQNKGMVQREIYLCPFVYAPVQKGTVVGRAVYMCGEDVICSSDLVTTQDVPARRQTTPTVPPKKSLFQRVSEKIKGVF